MSNMFAQIRKITTENLLVWLGALSLLLTLSGLALFVGDIKSTWRGIDLIQQNQNLNLYTNWVEHAALAVTPDVAGTVFFFAYLSNTDRWWAVLGFLLFFGIDISFDVYDRMKGIVTWDWRAFWGPAFTLIGYTIGSNVFVSFGVGLLAESYDEALDQVQDKWVPMFSKTMVTLLASPFLIVLEFTILWEKVKLRKDRYQREIHQRQ